MKADIYFSRFQKLREIDKLKILAGNFNTCLLVKDRTTVQKISEDIKDLIDTINQHDIIDIYRTLYPKITEYRVFLSAHTGS